MKKFGLSTIGVLLLCSSIHASVSILENTTSRLTLKWELDSFDTVSMMDSGKTVTALSFAGSNIALGNEGEPVIPGISLYAGMPVTGSIQVSFTPGSVRTVRLSNPLRKHLPPTENSSFKKKDDLQFDGPWISLPRYTWFRTMRAANVVVRPVRYDPSAGTIQVLESGVCTIVFPPGRSAPSLSTGASDYGRMLKKLVLNYDVASGWTGTTARTMRKTAADPYPMDPGAQLAVFKIGDGHSGTNETTIRENGVLKLSGAQVLNTFGRQPGSIGMFSVALYASWKGELPEACPGPGAIPAGAVEVPLIRIDNNRNGFVDNDDCFLGYVTGLSDWIYDSTQNRFVFKIDRYGDIRNYTLTIKSAGTGATLAKYQQPGGSVDTITSFTNHIMFKQSNWPPVSVNDSGLPTDLDMMDFIWERVTPRNTVFNYVMNLPDLDTSAGGSLRFRTFNSMRSVNADVSGGLVCDNCASDSEHSVTRWGNRQLRITRINTTSRDWWQLISLEATYPSRLSPSGDTLRMHVFPSAKQGAKTYRFSGLNGKKFYILRVPHDDRSAALVDSGSGVTGCVWNDSGAGARYFICNEAGFITIPDSALQLSQRAASSGYVVSDLRNTGNETDYCIITHPDFIDEAVRLAAHKAQNGFVNPRVVSINDIYSEFAGGNLDPVALRNFLAFVRRNWKYGNRLDYAVLMGKGHLDYKKIKTNETIFIPPLELTDNAESRCVDDFYAALEPGVFNQSSKLSVALGRLPCMAKNEAAAMVDKIIATETVDTRNADWGSWRNSMLLVADDDRQLKETDHINHISSSDNVGDLVGSIRPSMDLRKTYLFDYPWNSNYEKPEACRAIINEINNGVGFVNYFGHGSIGQWADERALMNADVPQLFNDRRYPVVSSFSCSVGHFDKPGTVSLSEALVKAPGAGAIATISGTRGSNAPSNETLAKNFYKSYFDTAASPTIGMAMISAKALSNDGNNLVYVILGDPSIRFFVPTRTVRLEFADSTGKPLASDTLKALQPIMIKGTVVDANGNPDAGFGSLTAAYVQLGFYNAPEMAARKDGGKDTYYNYLMPGKPVFSGRALVRNGTFEQTAILPRNLSLDKTGPRLIAYAWEASKVGLGHRNAFFHGSAPMSSAMKKDTSGPLITIRPLYDIDIMRSTQASFSDRIVSSLPLKCEIVINDQSGIYVSGSGPDEGLTMEIPGTLCRRNINQKFKFSDGDYRKGTAVLSFEENSLKTGAHTLAVTAQDMIGNVSKASFTIDILPETEITLDRVFNTPNPMRMGERTQIFFFPSSTTTKNFNPPLQFGVVIKFYSLSGRLLRVIKNAANGEYWDGRDQTGYQLPPNIYLYQVTAYYPQQEKQVRSKIEKIVIHPPR